MIEKIEMIRVGKYNFKIIDRTENYYGYISGRNFKIGGNYPDCVNISVSYQNDVPVSASIPYILYDDECSFETPLDRGQGTIVMIKTLLNYVHKELPSLREVGFEDKSQIECATEDEKKSKRTRFQKKHSLTIPSPLYYFSIAFNGKTWYEKYLNAVMKNQHEYQLFQTSVDTMLNSIEFKSNITYRMFVEKTSIQPYLDPVMRPLFENSTTFSEFFNSIPKEKRCEYIRGWITKFMETFLNHTFKNDGWIIPIPIANIGGKKSRKTYYLPRGRVRRNSTIKDIGITINNI